MAGSFTYSYDRSCSSETTRHPEMLLDLDCAVRAIISNSVHVCRIIRVISTSAPIPADIPIVLIGSGIVFIVVAILQFVRAAKNNPQT